MGEPPGVFLDGISPFKIRHPSQNDAYFGLRTLTFSDQKDEIFQSWNVKSPEVLCLFWLVSDTLETEQRPDGAFTLYLKHITHMKT